MSHQDSTTCRCCNASATYLFSAIDNRQLTAATFDYFHCSDCGMVFLDPLPANLGDYYAGGYQPVPKNVSELRTMAQPEAYRLEPILRYKRGGKLLEIGPWIGLFSLNAKDAGFDVSAIEMSADAAAFLNTVGIASTRSDTPQTVLRCNPDTYDVIALWHSLEHLPSPWEVVEAAAERLAPGGVLLISIPNIAGRQARFTGAKWVHLDAPRHLCFWSPDGLVRLGKRFGLEPLEITTDDRLSRVLAYSGWADYIRKIVRLPIIRQVAGRLATPVVSALENYSDKDGAGITAVFRRADTLHSVLAESVTD